jgi:hypothetical protein
MMSMRFKIEKKGSNLALSGVMPLLKIISLSGKAMTKPM